jgi:hypothetical protein
VRVLKALTKLTVKHNGKVFPSLEGLAYLAGVSRRSAFAAISLLEKWGFLTITRRSKRVTTPFGQRLVQDTSLYRLILPQGLAAMGLMALGISVLGSSGCKPGTASKTTTDFSNEEVRVAAARPDQQRLIPLPNAFETPNRRIHWSEMIKPRG